MNPNRVERRKKIAGGKPCALLWDESFLWGLMARQALTEAGLPFDLIRSDDIRAGILTRYAMLFVPGGWAQAKLRSLGEKGQAEIRSFVENGGSYLGICGGAGLATQNDIGLLPISRKATQERVPSFSGPVRLSLAPHAIWENIASPVFSAWWPFQFHIAAENELRVLAVYEEAQADAMSADIKVGDGQISGWSELEIRYGIFLDPKRLKDEPAVVEGRFGRGKVILSLVHFDTPEDHNGAVVLCNLWRYLIPGEDSRIDAGHRSYEKRMNVNEYPRCDEIIEDIKSAVAGLIAEGEQKHLWRRRNSLLLQWRRGVKGMEYSTLAAMVGEIATRISCYCSIASAKENLSSQSDNPIELKEDLTMIRELILPFVENAKKLLTQESLFLTTAFLSPVDCPDEKISRLRRELFGASRSYGGKYKHLIDAADQLLYKLIK
jgi:hypothetical protein